MSISRKFTRRGFVPLLALPLVLGAAMPQPASANEPFPSKNITFIVPWAAGGGSDAIARALQPGLQNAFGKPVVVQNIAGAGGVRGWRELARTAPDGHTIAVVTSSMLISKHLSDQGVDYRDFELLTQFAETPMVLAVSPTGPHQTIAEALKFAKANPERVRLGTAGAGTMWHIAGIGLGQATGSNFQFVAYKGGSEVTPAIMGNHIEGGVGTLTELGGLLKGGSLKPLAMFSEKRHPDFPNTPTLKESGVDFVWSGWWGLLAPKGTSPEHLKALRTAIDKAIESPEFRKFAEGNALTVRKRDAKEFAEFIAKEDADIAKLLSVAGVAKQGG